MFGPDICASFIVYLLSLPVPAAPLMHLHHLMMVQRPPLQMMMMMTVMTTLPTVMQALVTDSGADAAV